MGTAAASAGATGPFDGPRAGRSSGRTKPEYTAASGRRDHATFRERADTSVRRQGLGARLLATTSDEARARWYIDSAFIFSVQITIQTVGISSYTGRRSASSLERYVTFESAIKEAAASLRVPPLPTFRVLYTLVRQQQRRTRKGQL